MLVSVTVCTCRRDNQPNLHESVSSLLNQTYQNIEIIIVVDGNETLQEEIARIYGDNDKIQVTGLKESTGISGARNLGIGLSRGDVVAFLDDDAIADKRWAECLANTYQENDAISVAGRVLPLWGHKQPDYLPEELYWLVGLTYEGYSNKGVAEVRNALGPNMSFKKEVFEEVGLFSPGFGFTQTEAPLMQAEEPELALRMKDRFGKGTIYNHEIVAYHKVPESKTRLRTLLCRAFYQGYSKALLKRLCPYTKPLAAEEAYLKDLLSKYIPRRIKGLYPLTGSATRMKQLLVLLASIFAVGLGFVYGYVKGPSGDIRISHKTGSM